MRIRLITPLALAAAAALVAVSGVASGAGSGPNVLPGKGKKGGTLNVQSAETFEHLDPGQSYFQIDYGVIYAVQRPLYSFKPNDPSHAAPDLAAALPKISSSGKTVTIRIRPNVHYSPPVDRAVTSADVKYAIERGFSAVAPSGYAYAYFGDIVGVPKAPTKKVPSISGIQTPNKTTIVFKLKRNFGATLAKALSLPLSVPVPKEYAKQYDAHTPSTYDSDPTKQAFTGPYVISKYSASSGVTLQRNPNWKASTDFRPAYADTIVWKTGGDPAVVGKQVLASKNGLMMDTPSAQLIKSTYQRHRDQITFAPLGSRYVALNTQKGLTKNVNIRKAIIAVTDKVGMNLTRGGSLQGVPGTHFLTPGQPGFAQAGGNKGFGLDYMNTPNGSLKIAQKYMRKAGYPSGRYTGNDELTIVGSKEDPWPATATVFIAGLRKLGFKVALSQVPHSTMYSKFCGVPKQAPNICPSVGWLPDFPDGYANLFVPFDGQAITAANNANWPLLNDPKVNAAVDKAAATANAAARNRAWAKVDRLVSEAAPAVPWQWSRDGLLQGTGVHGVIASWNADWDLAYSYLD
ncbi:MAG TPA: ABC transporter substrate-binding protein [Solirubrobacteraceae bacterium]|jgi:peptide/nickel transport system substrate-binding protein|nr:ABC transporter substrate-binding protein [Solirubrobacteraceae bacterium]